MQVGEFDEREKIIVPQGAQIVRVYRLGKDDHAVTLVLIRCR